MVDKYPGVFRGPAGPEAIIQNSIANAAIIIGSPVTWAAPGTGEIQPRVTTATASTVPCEGIVVDGANRGTYGGVDSSITNPTQSASAAGQAVVVCKFGRAKLNVDGSTASIAIGDPLSPSTGGNLKKSSVGDYVIARAKQTSTAFGDIILAEVNPEGIL